MASGAQKNVQESQSGASSPDWSSCARTRDEFVSLVKSRGAELYRDLPWRNIDDPYAVLVSEVMLQQTQVARVLRFWPRWMRLFPTADALAAADTATVLEMWQGLGYNRRALALKRACEQCSSQWQGAIPGTVDELVSLPGIGPATAAGVVAFAFNEPAVYLETNVRSVFLHELFPADENVPDKRIAAFVADTCPGDDPRSWYYALLDYGAYLKGAVANPSRRSKHYARQSSFEGSHREKRSFVLKQVLASPDGIEVEELYGRYGQFEEDAGRVAQREVFEKVVDELLREGFFSRDQDRLSP